MPSNVPLSDVLGFWGKAQPDGDAPSWHPVAYHLLDVAAVANAILGSRPLALSRGARLLGLGSDDARRLIVALVALHDLGKFTPGFQAKAEPAGWSWPAAFGARGSTRIRGGRHTDDGHALWRAELRDRFRDRLWSDGRRALDALSSAVFGHHGRPCQSELGEPLPANRSFGDDGARVAIACADAMVSLLLPTPVTTPPPHIDQVRIASWWFAGLVTLTDWIGSNQRWFPYVAPDADDAGLARYWAYAKDQATIAVREAGVAALHSAHLMTFGQLTGTAHAPTPAQEWATAVALPEGPTLVILEDVTGSGKTEAAQMLVHRLMAAGRASGAYWAMPTQATANAMYERQAESILALYAADEGRRPSLALSHSQSRLHERFRASVLGSAADGPEARTGGPSADPELSAGAACAAFLADDRRAALLADLGAGSVDQALLGVLPSRYNTLRLFGLADKVLVVDEAHAYDAYMQVELSALLRFHAALGGCAIVLSATLARAQREKLARAWRDGLARGRGPSQALFGATSRHPLTMRSDYPLATIVSVGDEPVREEAFDAASWSHRTVGVRFVHRVEEAIEHVLTAARAGAAVVWVRNTVADCLEAADTLRACGIDPIVFHARFAQTDRQVREAEVLRLFGKYSTSDERRGRVLVATQVIEQSLDLDFDVMVSDLAPVDLLIQRAGRLRRHERRDAERPAGLPCELVVLAPAPDEEPAPNWLTALLPRTALVYGNVGVMWRTVRALNEVGAIRTPDGVRQLVEDVYASSDAPESLSAATDRAQGKTSAEASAANHVILQVADGYDGNARCWVDDLRSPTRLGEESTVVRLARVSADGALEPWTRGGLPPWKAWALSEVRLAPWRVPHDAAALPEYQPAVDTARADWSRYQREIPILPLIEDAPGAWRGTLVGGRRRRTIGMRYTIATGLAYQPPDT